MHRLKAVLNKLKIQFGKASFATTIKQREEKNMGDHPRIEGDSNLFWRLVINQPAQEPSELPIWWQNPDQYFQPTNNAVGNLSWTPHSNYNYFNENLIGVGSKSTVIETPNSETVIAPISDSHNNVWLAAYSERFNEPSFQNLKTQTNGLSVMFNTGDDSFIGFTGGVTNSIVPDNDHLDNYITPSFGLTFKFTD